MTRFAKDRRVYYVEEPVPDAGARAFLDVGVDRGVTKVIPHLPADCSDEQACTLQRALLSELMARERIREYVLWFYTPMALGFTDHLAPLTTVYDCMDELSAFAFAPPMLKLREAELLRRASVVFTGGQSLYDAKRARHANVHAFPSSVDVAHFAAARAMDDDVQAGIPHPRLGFFGVIDERMDLALIDGVAAARPDWHVVLVGPVVKIDEAVLPRRPNIHYLGTRTYEELPRYIAGWDVALIPFARNEATRYISPTKTPEYLAAGKPVVATSIRDVVRPYGTMGLARIADDPAEFVAACEAALAEDPAPRIRDADAFLRQTSWDGTWTRMRVVLDSALDGRGRVAPAQAVARGAR